MYFAGKISAIKNLGEAAVDGEKGLPTEKKSQIIKVFKKYEALLEQNNAFDFDDLIEKTVTLFKNNPDVLAKYQNMFDAILVDRCTRTSTRCNMSWSRVWREGIAT